MVQIFGVASCEVDLSLKVTQARQGISEKLYPPTRTETYPPDRLRYSILYAHACCKLQSRMPRTITRSQHHLRKRGTQRNRVIVHDQRVQKYIEVLAVRTAGRLGCCGRLVPEESGSRCSHLIESLRGRCGRSARLLGFSGSWR